jgi:hypothetical protein
MWQVTTFLSHMEKLPPAVQDAWKTSAGGGGGEGGGPADAGTKAEKKEKMDMPAH